MTRASPSLRTEYRYFLDIPTRWHDNDVYGHVNNAIYYFFFDTVVNHYLMDKGWLDLKTSAQIGLVVDTGCQFFAPISFPETVHAGLRVAHIGRSSVRYEIGLFGDGTDTAKAQGHFVHVYVGAKTRQPQPLSASLKATLKPLLV